MLDRYRTAFTALPKGANSAGWALFKGCNYFEVTLPKLTGDNKRFLFLQGPHGPFFANLAKHLRAAGAEVWRIGFNFGDQIFWRQKNSFLRFSRPYAEWGDYLASVFRDHAITDLVLYGDTRPIHATAIALARENAIRVHVFEEGYLRPYWATYERDGSNGNSALMQMPLETIQAAVATTDMDQPDAPSHWGDMRQHIFWGAIYHFCTWIGASRYRNFRPHRSLTIQQEFWLYLKRFVALPFHGIERFLATARIRKGGFPYHLAILQLEHDASFRDHSPFSTMSEFLELVTKGFAEGAPSHHHLVFKAHPLEDGRVPVKRDIKRLAKQYGVAHRVHFVRGGKLAKLLDHARSAVTVNSTAGQQVLWRGLALRAFGTAIYSKPEFVSNQAPADFFAEGQRPNTRAYRDFRRYLLATSQVPGGFYSAAGRRGLLRQVVDMILSNDDPYAALANNSATPRQQLRVVGTGQI